MRWLTRYLRVPLCNDLLKYDYPVNECFFCYSMPVFLRPGIAFYMLSQGLTDQFRKGAVVYKCILLSVLGQFYREREPLANEENAVHIPPFSILRISASASLRVLCEDT
jgi:hypothetical protein